MKKLFITSLIMIVSVYSLMAVTRTITISGMTFSPATLTAEVGDVLQFVVPSTHAVKRVSQSTWTSNGTALLAGGFSFGVGTFSYTITSNDVGIIYYVCPPH